ncbi:hypothetical protein TNCV_3673181 [Trichonephila clavipes]|nr:hypothetical protein TNCV_3673181 [Trichonephila clavipes]
MFDPSSFANPTPLAYADTSRDVLPRGGTSQTSHGQISTEENFHSYRQNGKSWSILLDAKDVLSFMLYLGWRVWHV